MLAASSVLWRGNGWFGVKFQTPTSTKILLERSLHQLFIGVKITGWLCCKTIRIFFYGLKQRCQRQFLALPRLDDIVSNQLIAIAGSIMVRHMILISVLSLPLRVYYLMRCTHNALWGVIMNSFDRTISYFGCVSCFWQNLQDLTLLGGMCIPFQYFPDFVVSWKLEWLGCLR